MTTLGSDTPKLLILTPQGVMFASIGRGVRVVSDAAGIALEAIPAPVVTHQRVMVAADGSVTVDGLVALVRNGITLTEGVDWERTETGARLTAQGSAPGDIWSAWVQQ